MTQLRHYDSLGTARFVTFSTYRRLKVLNDASTFGVVLKYIHAARDKHGFLLLGYVIMPEHIHLVLYPPDGMKQGLVIREIKSLSAREIFRDSAPLPIGSKRVFWQRRCYDHNCRTPEKVVEKIRYCHNNPVKRGLVTSPADWRWSSYNAHHGVDDVPLRVDTVDWHAAAQSN